MSEGNKQTTPRILAAAKEFNIGKETLIEFLTNKGFDVDNKPTTKLSEKMYFALEEEFAKDKAAKRKSESIELPKGSFVNKAAVPDDKKIKATSSNKIELETPNVEVRKQEVKKISPEPKVEEIKLSQPIKNDTTNTPVVESPKEEQPKDIVTPKEDEKEIKEVVKDKIETPAKTEVPVKETTTEKPVEKIEPKSEEKNISEEPSNITDDKVNSTPEKIETPKLNGPKIVTKIDLDAINQSTRPSKKDKIQKVEQSNKPETTPDTKSSSKPVNEKAFTKEANVDKKSSEENNTPKPVAKQESNPNATKTDKVDPNKNIPKVTEKTEVKAVETPTNQPSETVATEEKLEHIELKAPRLEGPKVIGKIELPVASDRNANNKKEKRKRKRIPVENKKVDPKKPQEGNNNTPQRNNNNTGGNNNHPGNNANRNNNNNNRNNNNQGGNRNNYNNRPNQGGGDRRFQNKKDAPNVPTEIDAKEIQEKIKETQAKLAGNTAKTGRQLKSKYRKNKRDEMAEKRLAQESGTDEVIQVTEFISVSELASLLDVNFTDVISKCMGLGIMVSINQRLDAEVIELVASEFDKEVKFIDLDHSTETEEEEEIDEESTLSERAPVVTIMGHVDHGKTSVLDYIRNSTVVAGEAGGITQHIGAYKVKTSSGKEVAFLDTPGHEAFTAMRARGAKAADIAVIVIAADDAIMPQTREAISHAQAANLPMVFALNKIDKDGANPEKIKEQLAQMNILVEDWGGKFQSQEISAKKGLHMDELLEKILLEAELLELKANPNKKASGTIIEAALDKGRGYVTTVLVQGGTLEVGDMLLSGQYFGKVKAMFNERGQRVKVAGPSTPVQILGLNGAPQAGEKFKVYADETEAKNIANHRAQILREQGLRSRKHITLDEIGRRLALGNFKELNVIIKADFDGSAEALSDSLQKLSTDEIVVNVVLKGVGQISESDIMLASASDAIIIGFQVRASSQASRVADQENIEIRYYSIIYDAINEVKSAMEGMLEPTIEKRIIGNIEVRDIFKISGVGTIAGCYVLDGKFHRNTKLNIIRDGIVVHHGELSSLKRYKDDVKEVAAGYECGLSIKNYNDVKVGDIIEGYEEVEVKRKL